jgi:hypothetical protein
MLHLYIAHYNSKFRRKDPTGILHLSGPKRFSCYCPWTTLRLLTLLCHDHLYCRTYAMLYSSSVSKALLGSTAIAVLASAWFTSTYPTSALLPLP